MTAQESSDDMAFLSYSLLVLLLLLPFLFPTNPLSQAAGRKLASLRSSNPQLDSFINHVNRASRAVGSALVSLLRAALPSASTASTQRPTSPPPPTNLKSILSPRNVRRTIFILSLLFPISELILNRPTSLFSQFGISTDADITDLQRSVLASSRSELKTKRTEVLLDLLANPLMRSAYLAYGEEPILYCTVCEPEARFMYLLFSLPSWATKYCWELVFVGLLTATLVWGESWRKRDEDGDKKPWEEESKRMEWGRERWRPRLVLATAALLVVECVGRHKGRNIDVLMPGGHSTRPIPVFVHREAFILRNIAFLMLSTTAYIFPPVDPPRVPPVVKTLGPVLHSLSEQQERLLSTLRGSSLSRAALLRSNQSRPTVNDYWRAASAEAAAVRQDPKTQYLREQLGNQLSGDVPYPDQIEGSIRQQVRQWIDSSWSPTSEVAPREAIKS